MSSYLDTLNPWPLGTPLPADTLFLVSVNKQEYRIEQSQLPSGLGGGNSYQNITRTALRTLVLEEELVPGRLYVVSGRTTGRPPVAIAAVSGSQFSGVANQLEADGTVTVGTYELSTDTFTAGGLGSGTGGGSTPLDLPPSAGRTRGILLAAAGPQSVELPELATYANDLHVWEPGFPLAHRRSLSGLASFNKTTHSIDIPADAQTLANAVLYGTYYTGAAAVTPPAPIYTATYTAVLADYQTKCSVAPPSGYTYPTGNGSSTVNQAAANTAAKNDAISKITCPVAPPSFNTTLNPTENVSTVTMNGAAGTQFKFNVPLSTNPDPNPATMYVFAPDGSPQIQQVDYNGADTGTQCGVVYQGQLYLSTFTNGNVTLS